MNSFGFLEEGAEDMVSDFGFLLRDGFGGELGSDFLLGGVCGREGLEPDSVVSFVGTCSSVEYGNTGVPSLKGVFSESESEKPSEEEEEISSMTGAEGLEVRGEERKAILADLREGLEG